MKTRYLSTMMGMALLAYLPLDAADDTFQMEAIPLASQFAADTSLPAVQMVSVTIAAASSVTANPCIGGTRGCPDPTFGYASIPFPSAVLPAGSDAVVTWMFQDLSYSGPIQMTVAFIQNGVAVGEPSTSHSNPSVVAGDAYLVHFATAVPAQAAAGSAMVVVNVTYGDTITRASQEFTVSAAPPDASAPAIQMVSVTIAADSSGTVDPCISGEPGCPDPTPGYASIPLPAAVLPLNSGVTVTAMLQDLSYSGSIEMTVAFIQNGAVVGQSFHDGGIVLKAGSANLIAFDEGVPPQASPGPAMIVASINYGGNIARASQAFTLQ
ncbi:MAG TPA: hypothetical protein VN924_30770 [Bryobacteraceae bacterium]|nr:hypothetical protein [Bryobacteraceae bacterium]